MRIKTIIALFAVLLVGSAFAGDSGNGCKLQGTWIGETPYPLPDDTPLDPTDDTYYMLKFFAAYHGTGDNEGADVLDWINPVPAPGTSWSNARGVWKKSGPNTYKYTLQGHIFDVETGDIVTVVRHTGTKTLTDCNTMEIISTVEYLTPDMTPMPGMCIPTEATLHRMVQEEPCNSE